MAEFDIAKKAIAALILVGAFVLWIGLLLKTFGGGDLARVGRGLAMTAALFGALVAVIGGLGSKRTSDYQNLGLLVLSAVLLVVAISV